jgi:hypothetical protein
MKYTTLSIIAVVLLAGCGKQTPIPSSRLEQPAGEFSFVTPEGWYRTKLAGIDFIIISGEPDIGAKPNVFIDFVQPGSLSNALNAVIESYQRDPSYQSLNQSEFASKSGLRGIKVSAKRTNKDSLPIATLHYILQDNERTIAITASCSEPVKDKYEPIFDNILKSLQSERENQQ